MALKRGPKSKFLTGDINDLLNGSEFLKDSPIKKKTQKRSKNVNDDDITEEEGISNLIGLCQANAKKKKLEINDEPCKESRQKILDVMNHQQEVRKQRSGQLLKDLSEVMSQLEADSNAMKDNEKKLEHLTGAFVKCMQQASTAHKQKLKTLKDIYASFKKQCEEMEFDHKTESEKLAEELEDDIRKLQQKLISETKKSGVEGLITKGAMKPDDRPLWFDIYRAFPPITEPKFAKPKPKAKPIRQIIYPEDTIRAKLHSRGHGLTAINILSENETQTKRLIQQYTKLKAEGVPESELIEKAVEAIGIERQHVTSKAAESSKIPENVTAEVNLKNIFKEE